ncbi:transposase [Nocardia sp. NPDC004340]
MLASSRIRDPVPEDLVRLLSPKELLAAWTYVAGPASTDLTDAEWQLLVPAFPRLKLGSQSAAPRLRPLNETELARKRRNLNGMRYKLMNNVGWANLPRRYGEHVEDSWHNYFRSGLFIRLHHALQDNPDAADLVAWLDRVIAHGPKKYRPQQLEEAA